jgi:hypothetical protein
MKFRNRNEHQSQISDIKNNETAFSSPLALTFLEKNIFKQFAIFRGCWPKYNLEMNHSCKKEVYNHYIY